MDRVIINMSLCDVCRTPHPDVNFSMWSLHVSESREKEAVVKVAVCPDCKESVEGFSLPDSFTAPIVDFVFAAIRSEPRVRVVSPRQKLDFIP